MNDLISRQAAIDVLEERLHANGYSNTALVSELNRSIGYLMRLPSAQPDITDAQAIEHLQDTGWMQNHDHEMYMMGKREGLADDSGSYDALIPAQRWIPVTERLPEADVEVFVYLFDRPSPYIAWISKDGKWHTEDFTLEVDENPAAWMPLPEPYKEEQDGIR